MLKDNLKKARVEAGLTQKQVAETLNILQPQYARWENGSRKPKEETIEKLANIFNTTTDALKGRDDGLEIIIQAFDGQEVTENDKKIISELIKNYFENK